MLVKERIKKLESELVYLHRLRDIYQYKEEIESLERVFYGRKAMEQPDIYQEFINEFIEEDPYSAVKLEESYIKFTEWYVSNEYDKKPPPRRDYRTMMGKRLKREYKNGWSGWKLILPEDPIEQTVNKHKVVIKPILHG